jgi:tetratricopeptide (TPR) repeat protein
MYDLASIKNLPINIVESIIVQLPDYLHEKTKCNLYVLAMAAAYRRLRNYNDIIDNCNKALEIDPNNADAWNNKGWAMSLLRRYEEAIECLDKALEIDPNNADAWNNKGWILNELSK